MRENDIVFFNLHRRYLNTSPQFGGFLGIFALASFLNSHGYRAQGFAGQLMEGIQLIDEVCKSDTVKVIGLYCDYENVTEVIFLCNYIKDNYDIPVIVGGPQATSLQKDFYIQSRCDVVVRYEGEITVLDLTNLYIEQIGALSDIKGISYLKDNELIIHDEQQLIENLDALPFIDDDCYLVPRNDYAQLSIMTGRGCPFHCSFCHEGHHTKKVRLRSVESVLNEIKIYIEAHPFINEFYILFTDDTFTLIPERVKALCEGFKELQKIKPFKWFCEGHVHTLFKNPEMIEYIGGAGAQRIQLGIEAGTQKVLDAYRKGSTLDEIRYVVKKCYEYEIAEVYSNIILAGAYFDEQVYRHDIEFAKELLSIAPGVVEIGVVSYWPLPETTITNSPEEFGLKILDYDFVTASGDFPQVETDHINKWVILQMMKDMETEISNHMKYLLKEGQVKPQVIENWLHRKNRSYFGRWIYTLNQLPHVFNYYSMITSKECFGLADVDINNLSIRPMRTVQLAKSLEIIKGKYNLCEEQLNDLERDILVYSLGKLSIKEIIKTLSPIYAVEEHLFYEEVKSIICKLSKKHFIVFSKY